jgi:hypothetical protein
MLNLSEISVVVELTIDKLLISGSSVEQLLNLMNSAMRFYTVWADPRHSLFIKQIFSGQVKATTAPAPPTKSNPDSTRSAFFRSCCFRGYSPAI